MNENSVNESMAPLRGLRVLDLSTMIAGPTTSTMLGDYGAEVIKVENPEGGDHLRRFGQTKDSESLYWRSLGRGKKSVALNLRDPDVQDLLRRWIDKFDILIENFRPGTLERWNLSPQLLRRENPSLIVLRVTAYGQDGPYRDRPGFGTLAEALSGLPALTGWEDRPPLLPPLPLADIMAGQLGAAAVLAAVHRRHSDGQGDTIDLAIYEAVLKLVEVNVIEYDQLGIEYPRRGNVYGAAAPRGSYQTADNQWLALSGSTQSIAMKLLEAIGGKGLVNDPRFATNQTRLKNVDELDQIISDWCQGHSREEAIDILTKAGGAVGPLETVPSMMKNPQVVHRNSIRTVEDPVLGPVQMTNVYPRFESWTDTQIQPGRSKVGADTDEVLAADFGEDWRTQVKNMGRDQ